MRISTICGMAALLATLVAGTPAAAVPSFDAAAIAAPNRPDADKARDASRHALALLAFSGLQPGDRVLDFMPGGGYFTRLFSHVVGPAGRVFAVTPAELAKIKPSLPAGIASLAAEPGYGNVSPVVEPTAQVGTQALSQGGALDMVWTSDNYHDMYGFFGPPAAAAANAAIFRALRPGGLYIVIDHAALPGASATAPTTLHRIDPKTVKAQVLAAGFVLDSTTDILANPADTHTEKVFAPDIRGRTDQFIFKFRKPAK
jgi:predicted methyltransferase